MSTSNRRLVTGVILGALVLMTGCQEMRTKREAFPAMYGSEKPLTILVLPAINNSTAADAGALLDVTVSEPFANHGYYILPVPLTSEIFRREGIVDGTQLMGVSGQVFRDSFGADAVLFITIEQWETNYIVIGGNVTVSLSYVMRSTSSDEILWSYENTIVLDTSGSSGNLLADVIATAITTATTDYAPIARSVHAAASVAMPYGAYHPQSGQDGEARTVQAARQEAALQAE